MCSNCDETVRLLDKTRGINSGEWTVVQFSFPGGKPELVKMHEQVETKRDKRGN